MQSLREEWSFSVLVQVIKETIAWTSSQNLYLLRENPITGKGLITKEMVNGEFKKSYV